MESSLIFSHKHSLVTAEERQKILDNYPLSEQIFDLQEIECCVNEIKLKTKESKIRSYCYNAAELILNGNPTIDGLTSSLPNCNVRQCYKKIIRAYIRIIWKKNAMKCLKKD